MSKFNCQCFDCIISYSVLQEQKKQRLNVLDHSRAATCFGNDSLLQTLSEIANVKEGDEMLKVGVVGKICFKPSALQLPCVSLK